MNSWKKEFTNLIKPPDMHFYNYDEIEGICSYSKSKNLAGPRTICFSLNGDIREYKFVHVQFFAQGMMSMKNYYTNNKLCSPSPNTPSHQTYRIEDGTLAYECYHTLLEGNATRSRRARKKNMPYRIGKPAELWYD